MTVQNPQGAMQGPDALFTLQQQIAALSLNVGVPVGAPTGVVAQDTANINAAIAALPASGGVLLFQAGTYVTTGNHVISVPCHVIGAGFGGISCLVSGTADNAAVTWIKSTSGINPLFSVQANNVTFTDLRMSCISADPTTGVGTAPVSGCNAIRLVANGNLSGCNARIERCAWDGWYDGVYVQAGNNGFMGQNYSFHCWNSNLYLSNTVSSDNGDWTIIGNWFLAGTSFQAPQAGVIYQSGAGIRFSSNKFNTGILALNSSGNYSIFPYNIWITGGGGECVINDNAFGNFSTYGIFVDFTGLSGVAITRFSVQDNIFERLVKNDAYNATFRAPSGAFALYANTGVSGNIIDAGVFVNNTILGPCGEVHLETARNFLIGQSSIRKCSLGSPMKELTNSVTNTQTLTGVFDEVAPSTFGATLFGSTNQFAQSQQVASVDRGGGVSLPEPSTEILYHRIQNPLKQLYSATVTAVTVGTPASILTFTLSQNHQFSVGDLVVIFGLVSSHAAGAQFIDTNMNNNTSTVTCHEIVRVPAANQVTIVTPNQNLISDTYTSGGYISSMGAMGEVLAQAGSAYRLDLDINAVITTPGAVSVPVTASLSRNVWVQTNGGGQPLMSVVSVNGTDNAAIDPTAVAAVGVAPKIANTQALGGAVATANAAANNPIFAVTAGAVGNGIEVVFESVKQGVPSGTYSCVNAATVSSISRVGGAATTIYRVTVTGITNAAMHPGSQLIISGCTGGFTGLNGTWYVVNWNGNTQFDFDAGADLGAGPATGTPVYQRDRYLVLRTDAVNVGTVQPQLAIGQTIASITGLAGQTISAMTNPSANLAQITTATPHGMTNESPYATTPAAQTTITVSGSGISAYNVGPVVVTVTGANTLTFPITGTGLADGSAGASYTISTGTRRIAQLVSNNGFLVDQPYPIDFIAKSLTATPVNSKLRYYVRPINNSGQMQGTVRAQVTGQFRQTNKINA